MPTNIKCPNCATVFDVEHVLSADAEQKLKQQYESQLNASLDAINADRKKLEEEQRVFEEKRKKENEIFQQKLQQEIQREKAGLQQELTKSITADFENQLLIMKKAMEENESKLKIARTKELEFLQKEQALNTKAAELEIEVQRKLIEGRNTMSEQLKREEAERNQLKEREFHLKLKELEKQLEDQRKLAEEMKRKAEQGSMQLQGEAQELMLEEMLKDHFPYDTISEVGKGVEGADCIQTVRNHAGNECGTIIFESKRTKAFQNVWIDKLKNDMRSRQADVAILVTQVYPKEMKCFGERDGVWICSFSEVLALTSAMRHTIIRIAETKKSRREQRREDVDALLLPNRTGISTTDRNHC